MIETKSLPKIFLLGTGILLCFSAALMTYSPLIAFTVAKVGGCTSSGIPEGETKCMLPLFAPIYRYFGFQSYLLKVWAMFSPTLMFRVVVAYWSGISVFALFAVIYRSSISRAQQLIMLFFALPGLISTTQRLTRKPAARVATQKHFKPEEIPLSPVQWKCAENLGVEIVKQEAMRIEARVFLSRITSSGALSKMWLGDLAGDTIKLRTIGRIFGDEAEDLKKTLAPGTCKNSLGEDFSARVKNIDSTGAVIISRSAYMPAREPKETASVTGYIWEVGAGNPNFESVRLPSLVNNQSPYKIFLWKNGSFDFFQELAPETTLRFPEGGVNKFQVLGIDPGLGVCPGQGEFRTALTFTGSGQFTGKKTSLTNHVPNSCRSRRNQ